jgi:hypothetical protein
MTKNKIFGSMMLAVTVMTGVAATPAEAHRRHYERQYNSYQDDGYYGRDRGYNNDRDYRDERQYRSNRSCNKGTGGLIIGGVAGGLLGNEVARRGNKTTGTIIGAAVGALAGRAIDRADSRCR